jgi:hypothetical protein
MKGFAFFKDSPMYSILILIIIIIIIITH